MCLFSDQRGLVLGHVVGHWFALVFAENFIDTLSPLRLQLLWQGQEITLLAGRLLGCCWLSVLSLWRLTQPLRLLLLDALEVPFHPRLEIFFLIWLVGDKRGLRFSHSFLVLIVDVLIVII